MKQETEQVLQECVAKLGSLLENENAQVVREGTILLKTFVGTASPMHLQIFNSFFFKNFFFFSAINEFSASSFISDHLKSSGIDINRINSLMLKTLISLG